MERGRLRPPLMLSLAMDTAAMAGTVMADPMVDMEAMAMERGRLRPLLMLRLLLMLSLAMDMAVLMAMEDMVMADHMVGMEAMDTARGRLRLLLMLSLAMDTGAMADLMAAMEVMVMADPMEDMEAMAMESKPQTELKPLSSNQHSCFN